MAKLHSYYGLCPIIDQYNLLGIAEDYETGHAIVTLGKNISIKYRIADQKQIFSWRTKDKYTSPVVYDSNTEKYVAAFNQSYLRMWDKEEEQVDKRKKFKFNVPIHTIISYLKHTFVVFTNGLIYKLNAAIEQRKTIKSDGIVQNNDYISDVLYTNVENNIYIGLIIGQDENKMFYWMEFSDDHELASSSFALNCSNYDLVGYMFNKPNNQEDVALITIWSNGKLYNQLLHKKVDPPGTQYTIIESLSPEFFITMLALDQDYIAMYGADKNGEGATLIIYNVQFKVVQSKQTFKMFKNQAKIWQIENNLLMCVGQNLAVVPFQLETEQLAALIGSHKMLTIDKDQDLIIKQELLTDTWEDKLLPTNKNMPLSIKDKLMEMTSQGYTDTTICEILIPELIEKQDVKSIKNCITFFCDIPEGSLASILKFILNADNAHFKFSKKEKDVILKPTERRNIINSLLNLPFNSLHMMPYIRKELDIEDIILLLKHIMYLLSDEDERVALNFEKNLIEWCNFLLDANYQKFLLGKDKSIIEFLMIFDGFVKEYLSHLNEIDSVVPYLKMKNKITDTSKHISSTVYSVEEISLF